MHTNVQLYGYMHVYGQAVLNARFEGLRKMLDQMLSFEKFGSSAAVCEFLEIDAHAHAAGGR